MWRVCKPGGHLYITVPAYMFLWGDHDVINQHVRRYTRPELLKLVQSQKGKLIYHSYFNSILFAPIAAFRLVVNAIQKIKGKNKEMVESDHAVFGTDGFFNKLLSGLFSIDYYLLKLGFRFPAGVSIMVIFKKEA